MAKKMLPLLESCKGCPHHSYGTAGRWECTEVDAIIPDTSTIPAFCPLPDYPGGRMSRIEETLRLMQMQKDEKSFTMEQLLLIAAKLKTEIGHFGEVVIPIEEGPEFLRWDSITQIIPSESRVYFVGSGGKKYYLYFGQRNVLMVAKKVPEFEEELWTEVPLTR